MDVPMRGVHTPARTQHARRLRQARRKNMQSTESYAAFGAQGSSQASEAHPLPSVSGLFLDLQEHTQRGRYINYGHQVLDELEQIRQSLLLNQVSAKALERMLGLLEEQVRLEEEEGQAPPDSLVRLLREIETRARVELAKLRHVASKAAHPDSEPT